MTAINYGTTTDIPGGIYRPTTVTQGLVWHSQLLIHQSPTATHVEVSGTNPVYRQQSPIFRNQDGQLILLCRNAVVIDETASLALPLWMRVRPVADAIIPSMFKITG